MPEAIRYPAPPCTLQIPPLRGIQCQSKLFDRGAIGNLDQCVIADTGAGTDNVVFLYGHTITECDTITKRNTNVSMPIAVDVGLVRVVYP